MNNKGLTERNHESFEAPTPQLEDDSSHFETKETETIIEVQADLPRSQPNIEQEATQDIAIDNKLEESGSYLEDQETLTVTDISSESNQESESTKINTPIDQISKFHSIISTLLSKPKTKFSSTELCCMIMYVRNFNGALRLKLNEAKDIDVNRVFEYLPGNFPSRTTLELSTINDYDIFHQTLLLEVTRLCSLVVNEEILECFEKFNNTLLVVVNECNLVDELLSLIKQEGFIESSSLKDLIDSDEDIVSFLERRYFALEFTDIMRGLINNFFTHSRESNYNIEEACKLICYINNFKETFSSSSKQAFNIEDIFDHNEQLQFEYEYEYQNYEEALLQQTRDLLKTIIQTKNIQSETIFNRFAQFIWKLLLFEKQHIMVNTAPNHLTCSKNIDKEIYCFKITLSNILTYKQTEEALLQVPLLIMFVKNLRQAIIKRFSPRVIFKPYRAHYPQPPVVTKTLKLSSNLDMYKLILYREVNQLCAFDKTLKREGCENYFRKFSDQIKIILQEWACGVRGFDSDDDDDDDASYEDASRCSCPKLCND